MGLDAIELVMSIEEKFGIEIPDADAQKLTTPGKLVDYIMARIKAGEGGGCLTQQQFHRLRRAMISRQWAKRQDLRPDTLLDGVVPKRNRRTVWRQLGEEIRVGHWPDLSRPKFILVAIFLIVGAVFLLPWVLLREGSIIEEWPAGILSVASAILVGWSGLLATRSFKTAFSSGYLHVGDLARLLVAMDAPATKADQGWTREQVRETVRAIIVEVTGVTEFSDDSHFVNDMHIN